MNIYPTNILYRFALWWVSLKNGYFLSFITNNYYSAYGTPANNICQFVRQVIMGMLVMLTCALVFVAYAASLWVWYVYGLDYITTFLHAYFCSFLLGPETAVYILRNAESMEYTGWQAIAGLFSALITFLAILIPVIILVICVVAAIIYIIVEAWNKLIPKNSFQVTEQYVDKIKSNQTVSIVSTYVNSIHNKVCVHLTFNEKKNDK